MSSSGGRSGDASGTRYSSFAQATKSEFLQRGLQNGRAGFDGA